VLENLTRCIYMAPIALLPSHRAEDLAGDIAGLHLTIFALPLNRSSFHSTLHLQTQALRSGIASRLNRCWGLDRNPRSSCHITAILCNLSHITEACRIKLQIIDGLAKVACASALKLKVQVSAKRVTSVPQMADELPRFNSLTDSKISERDSIGLVLKM